MFYKYLGPERINVLDGLKIRFTQPVSLNDPFESSRLIDISPRIAPLLDSIDPELDEIWARTSEEEKTPENLKALMDLKISTRDNIRLETSPHVFGKSFMETCGSRIGVLSLSRNFDNLLMWNNYAKEHTGFVIGFNPGHDFFRCPTFSGEPSQPRNVYYTSQRTVISEHDSDLFYSQLLCEKPIEWAYEEEVRIFRLLTQESISPENTLTPPVHLFEIPKDAIKSIYVGANSDNVLMDKIRNNIKCHDLDVDFYTMSLSTTQFKLVASKIE